MKQNKTEQKPLPHECRNSELLNFENFEDIELET